MSTQDDLKHEAALLAASYVTDGMVVGLGTGSTADYFLQELADRVSKGLKIVGVPTSDRSEARGRELGIPLSNLEREERIDITIDGADEVDLATFNVIKGRGGALLREKIVAAATNVEVIIADESKIVSWIGEHGTVPVEVIPFGWRQTVAALEALGARTMRRGGHGAPVDWTPELHEDESESPYLTDSGNFVIDCHWESVADAAELAAQIKAITGVVEHGIFINLVRRVVIAGSNGVKVYEHPSSAAI